MPSILPPERQEFEIDFMAHPLKWPYLVLPVKRQHPDYAGQMEIGTMVAVEGFLTTVFLTFMFHGQQIMDQCVYTHEHGEPDPDGISFIQYDSYEAIIEDGWRIDN